MSVVRFLFLVLSACRVISSPDPPSKLDDDSLFTTMSIKSYWPKNQSLVGVTTNPGQRLTWPEMNALCNATHLGHALAARVDALANAAKTLCPDDFLIPLGPAQEIVTFRMFGDSFMQIQEQDDQTPDDTVVTHDSYEALHWPTSQPITIDNEFTFRCAICQMSDRVDVLSTSIHPQHNNSIYAYDLELVSNHPVHDIGLVANGSDLANRLLSDVAEAFNISIKELRWHGVKLNEDRKAVLHVYYDRQEGGNMSWFHYLHWNDVYADYKSLDDFTVTMIKLNTECLRKAGQLENAKREYILTGSVDVTLDTSNGSITTRECYWNDDPEVESATWSPSVDWWILWAMRDIDTPTLLNILELRGEQLNQELRTIDVEIAFALEFTLISPLTRFFKIKALVGLSNMMLAIHSADKSRATAAALLQYSLPTNLLKLYMRLLPEETDQVQMHRSQFANVLIAAVNSSNPAVGMAIALSNDKLGNIVTNATQLNRDNMNGPLTSHIVFTMSDSIALKANRVFVAMYAAHLDRHADPPLDSSVGSWMSILQIGFIRNVTRSSDDDFVDIAFKPAFQHPSQRGKCAERIVEKNHWYTGNCRILKSPRDEMVVCRCKNMSVLTTQDDAAKGQDLGTELRSATYVIYGFDASLSTYLANNLTLVIVIIIVGVMSAAGLLCVILTALLFPEWRKDPGHKIFLHMVFALTVNLVLGFVNNFVSIDAKSIACIGIGVVRHYSFLVMFLWMMVLSGLQLKRLTTIAGAKATSHLILKVSLIAWGLPLVPIIIMLAWDTGFYKSEVSNRGYCYPEGVAFQATVQAPAGVILVANLVIFVFILNHIYGWVQCGDDVQVRKHESDNRAEQLRRLSTTIFIFFLFGFSWVFHFLSEEGIINSEFLFEFLFLITASFHLLMLSVFFIVLDKKTRQLWRNAGFGCLAVEEKNMPISKPAKLPKK